MARGKPIAGKALPARGESRAEKEGEAEAPRGGEPGAVVIVGAGPAGLTAAYELSKRGASCTVFEMDEVVGGLSRTVEREGWRFDIGGHRFFTKVPEVEELWQEILGPDDFLRRHRLSRIYYEGTYYDYPIRLGNPAGKRMQYLFRLGIQFYRIYDTREAVYSAIVRVAADICCAEENLATAINPAAG